MSFSKDKYMNCDTKSRNWANCKSKRQDRQLYIAPALRSKNSDNQKSKRPERQLYVAPGLRSKFNNFYEVEMENTENKDRNPSEATYVRAHSFEKHENPQKGATRIVPRRLTYSSSNSSSNPRNTSDESHKESYDSGHCEENVWDINPLNSLKSRAVSNQNSNSDYHSKKLKDRRKAAIIDQEFEFADNYRTTAEKSSRHLMQSKSLDIKCKTQRLKFTSDSKRRDFKSRERLFFDSDEVSVSDIEPTTDRDMRDRNALTSTPKSHVIKYKVLEAVKHVYNVENGSQRTLQDLSDSDEVTVNASRNEFCGFEIYNDSASIKSNPPDYSEIFGDNYIPPPVPPPACRFQFPPIPRLPSPVSLSSVSPSPHVLSAQYMSQLVTQQRHPRQILSPSTLSHGYIPPRSPSLYRLSYSPQIPHVMRSAPPISPYANFSIRPPRLPVENLNPLYLYQERVNPPNINLSPQEHPSYIPPPVPRLQFMNRCDQINNMNQRQNMESPKTWPRRTLTKR